MKTRSLMTLILLLLGVAAFAQVGRVLPDQPDYPSIAVRESPTPLPGFLPGQHKGLYLVWFHFTEEDFIAKGWEDHTRGLAPNGARANLWRQKVLAAKPTMRLVVSSVAEPCDMGRQLYSRKPSLTAKERKKGWKVVYDGNIDKYWVTRPGFTHKGEGHFCDPDPIEWGKFQDKDGSEKIYQVFKKRYHATCGNWENGYCISITPAGTEQTQKPADTIYIEGKKGEIKYVYIDTAPPVCKQEEYHQPLIPVFGTGETALNELKYQDFGASSAAFAWASASTTINLPGNGPICTLPGIGVGLPSIPGVTSPPDANRFGDYSWNGIGNGVNPLGPPIGTGGYKNANGG